MTAPRRSPPASYTQPGTKAIGGSETAYVGAFATIISCDWLRPSLALSVGEKTPHA